MRANCRGVLTRSTTAVTPAVSIMGQQQLEENEQVSYLYVHAVSY